MSNQYNPIVLSEKFWWSTRYVRRQLVAFAILATVFCVSGYYAGTGSIAQCTFFLITCLALLPMITIGVMWGKMTWRFLKRHQWLMIFTIIGLSIAGLVKSIQGSDLQWVFLTCTFLAFLSLIAMIAEPKYNEGERVLASQ